jgi:hypothetical protein
VKKTAFGATLALSVLIMSGCGDGIGDVTTGSGPSATPTPVPATPTPAPTAAPTATPGTSGTIACKLPKLPNCDAQCCSSGGSIIHRSQIESAQDELARTQPGLFLPGGNVRDNFEYMAALARLIQNRSDGNVCAEVLGHDEIRVKSDQTVSQHVDVLIADVTPAVLGAYTCRPASF